MVRAGDGALLRDVGEDSAVCPTARILAVGRFVGVVGEVQIPELVDLAVLHPAEAGEVGFGQVVGNALVAAILLCVVHAAGIELGMQAVVSVGFVGTDHGAPADIPFGQLAHVSLIFALQHEGQRLAGTGSKLLALLAHHEHAALAGLLVLRQAAVDAIFLLVLRADMTVDVCAVHVDFAIELFQLTLFHQRLTNLMRQYEGGLVLDAKITTQLQGRNALHRVGEDGDGREINLQRQLVEGKDRPTGDGEGVLAVLALPLFPSGLEVVLADHAARRTYHLIALAPANFLEQGKCLVVAHLEYLAHGQGAGFGGKQEVLFVGHGDYLWMSYLT